MVRLRDQKGRMAQDLQFTTAISGYSREGLSLRGVPLQRLIAQADFVATLFLSLTGKLPTANQTKLLNALLVAAMDHGLYPASGFVPRVAASSGSSVLSCMATALLALGPHHGAAVTAAMEFFLEVDGHSEDKEKAADLLVGSYLTEKKRVPGFGHPEYRDVDPRAQQLFALARASDVSIHFMNIARQVEHTLEDKTLTQLPLNIDGALAALFLTLEFKPAAGNALFGLARVAGSIAHILEEQAAGVAVRRLPRSAISYTAAEETTPEKAA